MGGCQGAHRAFADRAREFVAVQAWGRTRIDGPTPHPDAATVGGTDPGWLDPVAVDGLCDGDAAAAMLRFVVIAGLEILNLHAQGGMAEVYRARGRGADGTEYLYAVKRILPEYTRDPEIKKMFIEESRVAACLVHPSVVRVYDLATGDNEELFIVMEFLEGKDLSEAIEEAEKQKKPLPIWFAIQIARDVLKALHHVTTEATDKNGRVLGLIHRDISPHNIFVCSDGQVKLTDFGVAKVQESNIKTQVGITKGKLGYMSPEQLMGSPLDFRSDLYNVGILLFESITGRQLFMGASTAEFLQSMVRGIVPPIPPHLQVPPELEALIRRALDRDRNKRPATALDFERELGQIADRYGLTAQAAHVAHQMRELFGPPAPPPTSKPLTAPQKLRSMMLQAVAPEPAPQPQPVVAPQPQPVVAPQPQPYQPVPIPQPQVAAPYAPQPQVAAPQYAQQPVPIPQPIAAQPIVQQVVQPQVVQPLPPPIAAQPRPVSNPRAAQPPAPAQPQAQAQGGYQSPYARPQTIAPPPQGPVDDDDFATVVRPPEAFARPPRPASRPAQPLPPEPPSQPRVQLAVSARMQSLPGELPSEPGPVRPATGSQSLERRRPATVARGNARPLEAPPSVPRPTAAPPTPPAAITPSWQDATGEIPEGEFIERTRVEAPPQRPTTPAPTTPAPPAPPRQPTVQVGGGAVGVRSKRVVPLDDPKR
jgi:eukaryotic-like serine/threonine-protein kinase